MKNSIYLAAVVAAVLAELTKQEIHATNDDVKKVLDNGPEATGNWDDDVQALLVACLANVVDDELEPDGDAEEPAETSPLTTVVERKATVENDIDTIIGSLKVGYNFIPGIGAGWCRNEEDLEKMKDFVRGALTVQAMSGGMPCSHCGCDSVYDE